MKMNSSTKVWYVGEYPSDNYAKNVLNPDATFQGLLDTLSAGKDVYQYLFLDDESDSLIRERFFSKLAEINGVDYDVIYQKWLEQDFLK